MLRNFLMLCIMVLLSCGCPIPEGLHCALDTACSEDSADWSMQGGGNDLLTIDLPFEYGYRSLCTQGANGSYSHRSRSTRYDADFDTPNNQRDLVFAPIGGIAYAHDESRTRNYGNHITIDQGDGTYVIMAHLDQIYIQDEEEVAAGQLIGAEGNTGLSNGDHVHIGRHSGDASLKGEYGTSIDALAFRAYDTNARTSVTESTGELTCGLSTGHTYQSTLPTPLWHPSGSLMKIPDSSTVYVNEAGTIHPFLTEGAFTSRNYDWDDVVLVNPDELSCYIMGDYVSGNSQVTAVYDSQGGSGAWLVVGTSTDPNRYREQLTSVGLSAVLATWGISATSLTSLPTPSSLGITLSNYQRPSLENVATFRDGSLVSTYEQSDVFVMVGGAALPIRDWDTYLLAGFNGRTVFELPKSDFDVLVSIKGNCETDSYCIALNDIATCGGDTEDVPGTYPGEGTGGTENDLDSRVEEELTGQGLELWWWLDSPADWITISGEFTNESGYGYGWNQNIAWSTGSDELYFGIENMGSGDSFRYSYTFSTNGIENWSCLGPYPPGTLTGTAYATFNGEAIDVAIAGDPTSAGCGLEVFIP